MLLWVCAFAKHAAHPASPEPALPNFSAASLRPCPSVPPRAASPAAAPLAAPASFRFRVVFRPALLPFRLLSKAIPARLQAPEKRAHLYHRLRTTISLGASAPHASAACCEMFRSTPVASS